MYGCKSIAINPEKEWGVVRTPRNGQKKHKSYLGGKYFNLKFEESKRILWLEPGL